MLLHMVHRIFFADDVDEKRRTKGKKYPRKEKVWEKGYVVYVDLSAVYEEVRF